MKERLLITLLLLRLEEKYSSRAEKSGEGLWHLRRKAPINCTAAGDLT